MDKKIRRTLKSKLKQTEVNKNVTKKYENKNYVGKILKIMERPYDRIKHIPKINIFLEFS